MIDFTVPLPVRVNANLRGHSFRLGFRIKKLRGLARMAVQAQWNIKTRTKARGAELLTIQGLKITLTRVAPRELDSHDNLRTAMKPLVDGITDALGLKNDRTSAIDWVYAARSGEVREYAVEIRIQERPAAAPAAVPA